VGGPKGETRKTSRQRAFRIASAPTAAMSHSKVRQVLYDAYANTGKDLELADDESNDFMIPSTKVEFRYETTIN
jgi:hypothetical protein